MWSEGRLWALQFRDGDLTCGHGRGQIIHSSLALLDIVIGDGSLFSKFQIFV